VRVRHAETPRVPAQSLVLSKSASAEFVIQTKWRCYKYFKKNYFQFCVSYLSCVPLLHKKSIIKRDATTEVLKLHQQNPTAHYVGLQTCRKHHSFPVSYNVPPQNVKTSLSHYVICKHLGLTHYYQLGQPFNTLEAHLQCDPGHSTTLHLVIHIDNKNKNVAKSTLKPWRRITQKLLVSERNALRKHLVRKN
jgi:hypothetical protein